MSDTERVAMLWPPELKQRVHAVAGKRGLTQFTIDAVEKALALTVPPPAPEPVTVSSSISLDTPPPTTPPVLTPPVVTSFSSQITKRLLEARDADKGDKGQAATRARVDSIRAAAQAAGLELKPASQIDKPAPVAPTTDDEGTQAAVADLPDGAPAAVATDPVASPSSDACPDCFSPLVAGECWACAI